MITLQDIPKSYSYCFAGEAVCPKAKTCLRAIAARVLSETEGEITPFLHTINPIYVERMKKADRCPKYRDNTPLRYARGMKDLFDDVPLKKARPLRLEVMRCFSSRSTFFLCRKGEVLITPQQQTAIANIFKKYGISEAPKFNGYQDALNW